MVAVMLEVSILVLMEMVFLLIHQDFKNDTELGFNPCFDGNGLLATGCGYSALMRYFVSILVLMEMVFLQYKISNIKREVYGFNPCFDGNGLLALF